MLFVEGLAARLIEGIAIAVVSSLLASLAVAMLLIPALARWFLPTRIAPASAAALPLPRRILETVVRSLLRLPALTVLLATVVAGLSMWQLLGLGTELLPPSDPRQFSVRVVGPPGQRVESTAQVVEGIEAMLEQAGAGHLRAVLSEVGRLPEDDRTVRTELSEENTARLTVRMASEGPTGRQLAASLSPALDALASTEVSWEVGSSALASALGTSGPPVVVEISGQSLPDLRRGAEVVTESLSQLEQLWDVRSSFEGGPPELRVELDRAMADGLGVDLETLSRVLETSLDGRDVTMLAMGDEERPVTLRLPTPRREELEHVVSRTADGRQVALGEVARFSEAEGAREIFRRDQRRTAQVSAQIAEGADTPSAIAAVAAALDSAPLPPGLRAQVRGEEEERVRTFGELRLAGILAMVLVLMVLAGTFESLLHPITVLAAIPLGLVGVAVALVPTGQPIGMMAMMGLIVLAGVAVNDAVLLIDTARQLMARGGGAGRRAGASRWHSTASDRHDHADDRACAAAAGLRDRRGRRAPRSHGGHHHRRHPGIHRRLAARVALPVSRPGPSHTPRHSTVAGEWSVPVIPMRVALYDRIGSTAFSLAARVTNDREAAEEAVATVFATMPEGERTPASDDGSADATRVLLAVRRDAFERRRGQANPREIVKTVPTDLPVPTSGSMPPPLTDVYRDRLRLALDSSPSQARDAIELVFFEGLTEPELATRFGSSASAVIVREQIRSSLKVLRDATDGRALTLHASHDDEVRRAAVFALGGLQGSERDLFEQHLDVCRACVDEVSSFLPVTRALAFMAPPQSPQASLRDRIMYPPEEEEKDEDGRGLVTLPIRRPVAVSMFFLGIMLVGAVAWQRMPVELFPAISGDRLFINFVRPGSEAQVIEREILIPLQARVAGLAQVSGELG